MRIKIIDKMNKGDLVIQLSYSMSPVNIHARFKREGYDWDGKIPSVKLIGQYIDEKRFKEPNFLRSESYVILTTEFDEPRVYRKMGNEAKSEFKRHMNHLGPANVQLLRVVPFNFEIGFGDQGGAAPEQEDD